MGEEARWLRELAEDMRRLVDRGVLHIEFVDGDKKIASQATGVRLTANGEVIVVSNLPALNRLREREAGGDG